jgi:ppGpp synthetase/RelA/SpoT-type nucleotidyltranferase
MANEVSKTQIDRLGNRLKSGAITEDDLRLLDRYRRTFTTAYEVVVVAIRDKLGLEPTGRPAKSTISIIDKLKRESIRLTQIQDIAGCRIIVADIAEQESVIQSLTDLFPQSTVIDRRAKPSHGYRAVHVVVHQEGKLIEIQVRTTFQQIWAEMSEKLSDLYDLSIKYGGGDEGTQTILKDISDNTAKLESFEKELADILARFPPNMPLPDDFKQALDAFQEKRSQLKNKGYETIKRLGSESKPEEENQ